MKENLISFNSIKYNYSLKIDGKELVFKIESINHENIYFNHFSSEKLREICPNLSTNNDLNEYKNKIEEMIKKKSYNIKLEDDYFIINFDIVIFQYEFKLSKKDESSKLNYNCLSNEIKKIIDENKLILGIDFGTTFSNASVLIGDEVIIIPNDFGKYGTPSYISFIDDKKYYTGELAKLTPSFDKNTIYSIKRLIGRKYNENYYDQTIEEIKNNYDLPFEVIKDSQSDKIKIIINYEKGEEKHKKEFFPEQLCAMILKKIITDSEYYLSKKIKKTIVIKNAVITVPAYFNQRQRTAIKESAKIINLNVKNIINEPTAASLFYGHQEEENAKPTNILIIDFGGGTLDITIVIFTKNKDGIFIDVTTSRGHSNLGGDDFDLKLMEYCLKNQNLGDKIDINLSKNIRLKRACEEAKIELSTAKQTNIKIYDYQNSIDIDTPITREIFNNECSDLFSKFEHKLDSILKDFKESQRESVISKILLIGGTTLIPKVKDIISTKFPQININQSKIDNFYSVSKGAAIFGVKESFLNGKKKIYLYDVANLPLGVEILGGEMSPVVKKNEKIPFDVDKIYQTVKDNQTIADIRIYEGENLKVKDNFNLGNFTIRNLPKKPAGKVEINLKFYIDENSCLSVKAFDLSNKKNIVEKKVDEPQLFTSEDIIMLKEEVSNMKELNIEDYNIYYKEEVIEIEEKINQSAKNENILQLIDKLSDLIKKPYESLKIYISLVKYYFKKINEISKEKKIEINENLLSKFKLNIKYIFQNIQFYDKNVNDSINIDNYDNILKEMIDDLMINDDLYNFCLNQLLCHYIEKVKSYLYFLNLNHNNEQIQTVINKSRYFLNNANKILEKLKEKQSNSLGLYEKKIEDLNKLVDFKELRLIKIREIYYKFIGNSFLELINDDDISFLGNILPKSETDEIKIETFINYIRHFEGNKECVDLDFITSPLFFILDEIKQYNEYDEYHEYSEYDERERQKLRDELCNIKGYFKIKEIKGRKKQIYEFLIKLKGHYDTKRNKNEICNKICIYLTKVIELAKKIKED